MLQSMTGYGSAQGSIGPRRLVVETRSVNHKFCEVNLRLPPRYAVLEGRITDFTRQFFSRGRFDIFIKDYALEVETTVKINEAKLRAYDKALRKAAKALALKPDISLELLLSLPHVFVSEEEAGGEKYWRPLQAVLKASFISLEKMRQQEGQATATFLKKQLDGLSKEVKVIQGELVTSVEQHQKQLGERIQKLLAGVAVDAQKLAQEVAFYVDRTDVSEELQRLTHHIEHFYRLLAEKGPVGRKFDFLLQEMNRETNTLSAKAQNAQVSQRVVECKHLLEKMREQVQNIE